MSLEPISSLSGHLLQAGGLAGVTAAFFAFHLTVSQALGLVVAVMFVVVGDQVRSAYPHNHSQAPIELLKFTDHTILNKIAMICQPA